MKGKCASPWIHPWVLALTTDPVIGSEAFSRGSVAVLVLGLTSPSCLTSCWVVWMVLLFLVPLCIFVADKN